MPAPRIVGNSRISGLRDATEANAEACMRPVACAKQRRRPTKVKRMDLDLAPADLAFRDEVRAFLDAELTDELRSAARRVTSVFVDTAYSLPWQRILNARGWAAPSWPKEYGGA